MNILQLDWTPSAHARKINQLLRKRRATTIPRPPFESSRRGESNSALTIFVKFIFDLYFLKQVNTGSEQK